MAIEGPLRELGIHDVFQLLDLSRKTGSLRVTSDLRDDEGYVLFEGGKVLHASVRSNPTSIERILRQAGKLTDTDVASAQALAARPGEGLGDRLVAAGVITQKEMERHLRQAIENVVFELMSWREGFFSFEEKALADAPLDARIRISTESLLMEGARRIDEWSRIADKVPSLGVIPSLAPVEEGRDSVVDLLPHEWEVLMTIDGAQDLRAIAASLGRSEFEVAKIVYGLVSTGVVVLAQPDRATPRSVGAVKGVASALERGRASLAAGRFDEALSAARSAIAADATSAEAHRLAGRALARLGRHGDAVEELRRAVQVDPLTPEVHLDLGFAAVRVGDFANARASWEHFLRLAPAAAETSRVNAALEALTRMMHLVEAHTDAHVESRVEAHVDG
jgi:cytochrome c-type biogenesis protein CcmH/NrfG